MSKNIIVIGSCNTDMVIKADRLLYQEKQS